MRLGLANSRLLLSFVTDTLNPSAFFLHLFHSSFLPAVYSNEYRFSNRSSVRNLLSSGNALSLHCVPSPPRHNFFAFHLDTNNPLFESSKLRIFPSPCLVLVHSFSCESSLCYRLRSQRSSSNFRNPPPLRFVPNQSSETVSRTSRKRLKDDYPIRVFVDVPSDSNGYELRRGAFETTCIHRNS